jgi:hypothetical protein
MDEARAAGIKPPLLPDKPLADSDADPQLQPRPLNRTAPTTRQRQ